MPKLLNRPFFPLLGLSCLIIWVTWQRVTTAVPERLAVDWDDSLHLLSAASYACLLIGSLGLRRAFFLFRKKPLPPFSTRSTLLLAFFIPFLVSLIPIGVENLPFQPELIHPSQIFLFLRIWLPSLQVFSLGCLLLLGEKFDPARFQTGGAGLPGWAAGLVGLGLWLASTYSYHLSGLLVAGATTQDQLVSPSRACLAALVALAQPLFAGFFFRGQVLPSIQKQAGFTVGIIACAGMSAFLSLQPILWIPGFLASLGFTFLAAQPGGLRASIYAQAVFNTLALLIVPGLIV